MSAITPFKPETLLHFPNLPKTLEEARIPVTYAEAFKKYFSDQKNAFYSNGGISLGLSITILSAFVFQAADACERSTSFAGREVSPSVIQVCVKILAVWGVISGVFIVNSVVRDTDVQIVNMRSYLERMKACYYEEVMHYEQLSSKYREFIAEHPGAENDILADSLILYKDMIIRQFERFGYCYSDMVDLRNRIKKRLAELCEEVA